MSNNRRQAMQRLMCLKARFKRNLSFFVGYKKFMDELIAKKMQEMKVQEHFERIDLSHTMGYITQASLCKLEGSLIRVQSLMCSSVYKLDPNIENDGLLRVGGQFNHSALDESVKHPLLILKQSKLAKLIIK